MPPRTCCCCHRIAHGAVHGAAVQQSIGQQCERKKFVVWCIICEHARYRLELLLNFGVCDAANCKPNRYSRDLHVASFAATRSNREHSSRHSSCSISSGHLRGEGHPGFTNAITKNFRFRCGQHKYQQFEPIPRPWV